MLHQDPGLPVGKGWGETGDGPEETYLGGLGPWVCALQGEAEGAGVKSDEDGEKQNGRSLSVLERKVKRRLTQTSLCIGRWYKTLEKNPSSPRVV